MKLRLRRGFLAVLLICLLLFVAGCGGASKPAGTQTPGDSKGKVHIVYVEWVCATASTHIIADVLQNRMGYEVQLTPVSAALMFEALAQGQADFLTTAWLPVAHGSFVERLGDRLDKVRTNTTGAKLGLAVPAYVEINSIEDLNSIRNSIRGEITGIDPGAGIMRITEDAIKQYGLNLTLIESSDATMTAVLRAAIDRNDPVVITAWEPHWKFSRWNLKFLDDPKLLYGGDEDIVTIARLGLNESMPEVYELLKNFYWSIDKLNEAIMMAEESGDSVRSASEWVTNNPDIVNSWLPEAYKK